MVVGPKTQFGHKDVMVWGRHNGKLGYQPKKRPLLSWEQFLMVVVPEYARMKGKAKVGDNLNSMDSHVSDYCRHETSQSKSFIGKMSQE